jgi:hypothetical protein
MRDWMNTCCGNCKWHDREAECNLTSTYRKEPEPKQPLCIVQREAGKRQIKKPDRLGVVEDQKADEIKTMRASRGE